MPDIFSEQQTNQTAPAQQSAPHISGQEESLVKPVHLFTTYCQNPKGVSFAEQETDEDIILFLRRDFITNVPWIAATVGLALVPFLVRFIFVSANFSLFTIPQTVLFPLIVFYFLIVLGFAFANLVSWFYNIGLVTNKRGVDLDFIDLATIDVATASLPDIKDVEYTQAGFFQSLFDYGDVRLRIEATGEVFVFEKVPRPTEVAGILSNLVGRQSG